MPSPNIHCKHIIWIHLLFPPSCQCSVTSSSAFCERGSMTAGSQRAVRMSWSRLLSSLYTNDREARCLWRVPYHNGRLTSDDISCCTTRFLSWGIGVSWSVIADSLSDLSYNWNKTRIASKTVLPWLKPLSVHTSIIWQRRQFSLRVGLLTKAVKSSVPPGRRRTLNAFRSACVIKWRVKNVCPNNKML